MTKMKLIKMTGTSFVMARLKVASDDGPTVDWPFTDICPLFPDIPSISPTHLCMVDYGLG